MPLVKEVLDLILDTKRIATKAPGAGPSRMAIWRTYLRLKLLQLRRSRPGDIRLFKYHMRYFEPANLVHLFREIFVNRLYDIQLTSPEPTIIDCGSNIGMSILFFKSLYPSARVIGFEANPLTFPVLRENVERNGLESVVLHQKALSDQIGHIDFFVDTKEPGALDAGLYAGLYANRGATALSVPADLLSAHIEAEVDLLKLDIEGAEELVITDLARNNKLQHVRNIICEYHHHHRREGGRDRLSHVLSMLEGAGFGYQLEAWIGRSRAGSVYQDVLIYAHRRERPPA